MLKLRLPSPLVQGEYWGQCAFGREKLADCGEEVVAQSWTAIVEGGSDPRPQRHQPGLLRLRLLLGRGEALPAALAGLLRPPDRFAAGDPRGSRRDRPHRPGRAELPIQDRGRKGFTEARPRGARGHRMERDALRPLLLPLGPILLGPGEGEALGHPIGRRVHRDDGPQEGRGLRSLRDPTLRADGRLARGQARAPLTGASAWTSPSRPSRSRPSSPIRRRGRSRRRGCWRRGACEDERTRSRPA